MRSIGRRSRTKKNKYPIHVVTAAISKEILERRDSLLLLICNSNNILGKKRFLELDFAEKIQLLEKLKFQRE